MSYLFSWKIFGYLPKFCDPPRGKRVLWLTASYWEGNLICKSRAKGLKGAYWWPPAKSCLLLKWLSMLWPCALDNMGTHQRLLHMCDEKHHSERSVSNVLRPFHWDVWTVLSIKDRHGISLNLLSHNLYPWENITQHKTYMVLYFQFEQN